MQQDLKIEDMGSPKPVEEQGEWMLVLDASTATGLSPATLRRYIKNRRLKSRRLGRTSNAKVQVWVTPDLLDDREDRISTDGLDEILTAETDSLDEEMIDDEEVDQADQATRETLRWMRSRLDERDLRIEELVKDKDQKIEELSRQLQAAVYRNGYLEAQQQMVEEKIKLIEDKSMRTPLDEAEAEPDPESRRSFWKWLFGKKD